MSGLAGGLVLALAFAAMLGACSGACPGSCSGENGSGRPTSPSSDDPATPGSDGGGAAADITPEPLPADPLTACPEPYRQTAPVSGLNTGFVVAGQSRELVLILPPASFTGPRPLFVGFNGTSENGTKFAARAKLAEFAAKGFIVVVPSSVGNGFFWPIWDGMRAPGNEGGPNKDLELFDTLVGCTAAHFSVDKKRVFVGGHSAGGIFANKVLRARSNVVAGGIVGSGVFSLTSTGTAAPMDSSFVLVTWGGDNDTYRGTTPNGVNVPEFSFVEQASLASTYYEAQPGVHQAHCRGNNLGHAWLPINGWFIDALLSHPKGAAAAPLAPVPANAPVVCSEDAYAVPPLPAIVCGTSTTSGCQTACQLMADCIGENRTVGTVMKEQLSDIGFMGTSCAGCVTRCQQSGATAANAAVLSCFQQAQSSAQCGAGIEGSFPFMTAVDTCCKGRTDSSFCLGLCTSIRENDAAAAFFPVCQALVP